MNTYSVEYKSSLIGEYTFDIRCKIEKLRKALNIPIVAQVMEISSKVVYTNYENQKIEIIKNCNNVIDVGQVKYKKIQYVY